jgi:hypothetical protein
LEVRTERTFSSQEKQQALALVLQSDTFARAGQLRRFLRYISEMEAAGRADEISEYSVGIEALGRPVAYSPTDDSGVRGRAHDLRQKLQQLYRDERPDAQLRIGLKKGSYIPFFYEVAPSQEAGPLSLVPDRVTAKAPSQRGTRRLVLGIAAILTCVAAAGGLFYQHRREDAILRQFWGPMLRPGANVLLCLAIPPALAIKPFPAPPRHPGFQPAPKDVADWYATLGLPGNGEPYLYHSTSAPLFGDAAAAVEATQIIAASGGSVQFLPENILGQAALRNRNILLIGSPNYSPYAARVLRNTPFMIVEDDGLGEEVVRERSPQSASALVLVPSRGQSGKLIVAYGLITVFPNRTGSEEGPRAIVVSGVTGAGAPAAMEFLTSPAGLAALRDGFRKDGLRRVPASYQVIVKGSRDQAMPLNWALVAYRVMEHPPSLE